LCCVLKLVLLGLSEAEERRQLEEIYAVVVELTKLLSRDQFIASSAMVIIHKYFKLKSLVNLSSPHLFIATSSVFISAKVLYMPVTLEKAVQALFHIEKRQNPASMMKATLTKDRENHYRDKLEKVEFEIL
jgi:hypothetical protein